MNREADDSQQFETSLPVGSSRNRGQSQEERQRVVQQSHSLADSEPPDLSGFLSLRWKILSIAMISSFALMLYLAAMVNETKTSASMVEEIFSQHYPAGVLVQSTEHSLALIHRELEDAVITGDEDALQQTIPMAAQVRKSLRKAASISPIERVAIHQSLEAFELYYLEASELAKQMLSAPAWTQEHARQGERSNKNYRRVRDLIHTLKQNRNDTLVNAVQSASERAEWVLLIGTWASLCTAAVVLLLALVIAKSILKRLHRMVDTLRQIAQAHEGMSARIELDGQDEMTELAYWFNAFIGKLERVSRESTEEITRIAYTDTLSGLPNRRHLIDAVETAIKKNPEQALAVMFLDLDNFKPINDQLGHEAGDELIRQAANRLNTVVQYTNGTSDDVNETNAMVGRLGGDEFMVLLPRADDRQYLEALAHELRETLLQSFNLHGSVASIGVSTGIALYPQDAQNKQRLIDCADMAMYEAKNAGKNTYRFFHTAMAESLAHDNRLEQALKSSLQNNELALHFQAKFDLEQQRYLGAEALLRWKNPEFGTLSPLQFVDLAEKCQVMHAIDDWVLEESCRHLADWIERGLSPGRIAINMSAKQIQRTDLLQSLLPTINRYRIPGDYLTFEITETSVMDHLDVAIKNVLEMREHNMHVCMDDFGAGHSSLSLLANCSLDAVKIDQSLVGCMVDSSRHQRIVCAIINLANTLNIDCIAEGIENEQQLNLLKQFNCKKGQGYLLAVPCDAGVLEFYMHNNLADRTFGT
ncbi:MAG: putative bifunctional diguanylate cyclase/phosphodiesterase [Granulosicoccaceae bacterium]